MEQQTSNAVVQLRVAISGEDLLSSRETAGARKKKANPHVQQQSFGSQSSVSRYLARVDAPVNLRPPQLWQWQVRRSTACPINRYRSKNRPAENDACLKGRESFATFEKITPTNRKHDWP
jgi:hypothetical protein